LKQHNGGAMSYILVEYSTDDFGSGIFESITPMTNDAGTKIEIFKSEQDALKVLYDLQSSVPDIYDYDMDISVERIH
tara:strand:- start:5838 stop:6068 length:231 start_codon:yes stop_codon:yes gene_type:complete